MPCKYRTVAPLIIIIHFRPNFSTSCFLEEEEEVNCLPETYIRYGKHDVTGIIIAIKLPVAVSINNCNHSRYRTGIPGFAYIIHSPSEFRGMFMFTVFVCLLSPFVSAQAIMITTKS